MSRRKQSCPQHLATSKVQPLLDSENGINEVEEVPSSETCLKSSLHEKEEGEENGDNVPVQGASFIESSDSMSEMPLQSDSLTSDMAVETFGHKEGRRRQISNCINNDNNNESSFSPKHEKIVEPDQEMMVFEEEIEETDQCRRRNPDLKDHSQRNGFKSYLNHSPVNHSSISDVTEEEGILGYLNRSDTAVIFPEPVNNKDNASSCNKRIGASSITVSRIATAATVSNAGQEN